MSLNHKAPSCQRGSSPKTRPSSGYANLFADAGGRYPQVELAEIDRPGVDLVLLPDEPYVFTAADGPEAFATAPTRLVSGPRLTWDGPSLLEAARLSFGPPPSDIQLGSDRGVVQPTVPSCTSEGGVVLTSLAV